MERFGSNNRGVNRINWQRYLGLKPLADLLIGSLAVKTCLKTCLRLAPLPVLVTVERLRSSNRGVKMELLELSNRGVKMELLELNKRR